MASEITTDRLRALAETRSPEGQVLSLFINLDPHEFPTPSARGTEIRAMLDLAGRTVRDHDALTAAERTALEADVARVREHLTGDGKAEMTNGTRGLAVFASEPAGLFDVLALPRAVTPEVRIGQRPAIRTIARLASTDPWWIVLVDRRHARLLSGTTDGFAEHWRTEDDVAGHHDQSPSHARDQGGTSHERHQRSADKDVSDHLRGVASELRRLLEDEELAGLLIGGPADAARQLQDLLPTELARCVKGTVEVDVWSSSPAQVLAAALPQLQQLEQDQDDALLERVADGIGTGRGAAGLGPVLDALNERRVQILAVATGTSARGVRCPSCGWLGITAGGACPADGIVTEPLSDIVEEAVGRALAQGADAHVLAADSPVLVANGGIAAALRF